LPSCCSFHLPLFLAGLGQLNRGTISGTVTDASGRLTGIVTDGDLRRHLSPTTNLLTLTADDVMTRRRDFELL
jgi:CBS domain-containing protein